MSTPSLVFTGESRFSSETLRAMTDSDPRTLVTLTRRPLNAVYWPGNVTVLRPDDPWMHGARNAAEMVAQTEGVLSFAIGETESPRSAGVRGGNPYGTQVLLDGRPLSGAAQAPFDLSSIPVEQIDRIEIVRGGMSALFGPNASGGVIHILSKRAAYTGAPLSHFGYEARSHRSSQPRLDFGSRWGRYDFAFYGNAHRLSGFRDNTQTKQNNIGGNLGVAMGKAGKLLFDAAAFHREAGVPGTDPLNLDPSAFNNKDEKASTRPASKIDSDKVYARTSYLLPMAGRRELALRAYHSGQADDYRDSDNANPALRARSEADAQTNGVELQLDAPRGFSFGADMIHDRLDHRDVLVSTRSVQGSANHYGAWLQSALSFYRLSLVASLRYGAEERAGNGWSPRVQGQMRLVKGWSVFGSAASAFVNPRLPDLLVDSPFAQSNPGLRRERAWTTDAGARYDYGAGTFTATGFQTLASDAIEKEYRAIARAENIADVRRRGVELVWSHTLNSRFRDELRYTFLENRGRPEGFAEGTTLGLSPRHRADWLMSWRAWGKVRIDPAIRYRGAYYARAGNQGRRFGERVTGDVRLSFPWRQLECYAGINNVTNRRYEDVEGYPLPGITAYGGFRLRLWG